jgi:hypothetical protein
MNIKLKKRRDLYQEYNDLINQKQKIILPLAYRFKRKCREYIYELSYQKKINKH